MVSGIAHRLGRISSISNEVINDAVKAEKNILELKTIRSELANSFNKIEPIDAHKVETRMDNTPSEVRGISTVLHDILQDVTFKETHKSTGVHYQPMVKTLNKPLAEIVKDIRLGNLDELLHVYGNRTDNIATALSNTTGTSSFKRFMERIFPDSKLRQLTHDNVAYVRKRLDKDVYDRELHFDKEYGGLDDLYHENKKFRKLIDNLESLPRKQNRRRITIKGTFITITVGLGIYALFNKLVQQAEKLAGCWRVYVTQTGKMAACKIAQCSCAHKDATPETLCVKLPRVVNIEKICTDWPNTHTDVPRAECRKCDTTAHPNSPQYLSPEEMIDPRDVYMCRSKPNLGTLLTEFIRDLPQQIWEGVTETVSYITTIVMYIVIFVLGGIVVAVLVKCNQWYRNLTQQNQMAPNEDERKINNLIQ